VLHWIGAALNLFLTPIEALRHHFNNAGLRRMIVGVKV
jgi:hypothetical protein